MHYIGRLINQADMKRVFVEGKRKERTTKMKMKGLTADGHWLSERRREEGALSFLLLFLLSLKLSLNSLVDVIVFVNRRACSRVCLARPTVSFVLYRPNDSISGRDRVTRLTVPVCVSSQCSAPSSFLLLLLLLHTACLLASVCVCVPHVTDTDCALHEWPSEQQEANKAQLHYCRVAAVWCTASQRIWSNLWDYLFSRI